MTTIGVINLCHGCEHLDRTTRPDERPRCAAFAEIPGDIYANGGDHRTPVDGDHGIVFSELLPGTVQVWLSSRKHNLSS